MSTKLFCNQLPKGTHVSSECKNLLFSLLKHNPNERISFDDFFAHEFLDLEHAPTRENYEKAVAMVQVAVKLDSEKNYKEAYYCYCDALRYFIPILTSKQFFIILNKHKQTNKIFLFFITNFYLIFFKF